jgi:hypothetical protein
MHEKTIQDYRHAVKRKLAANKQFGELSANDVDDALADAVDLYSRDRPHMRILVVEGEEGGKFRYDLPSEWEDGFSNIIYVEFPAGDNALQSPKLLDIEDVRVWDDGEGKKIHFLHHSFQVGDTAVIKYSSRHVLNSITNSIPDADFTAVVTLASAFAALTVAGHLLKKRGHEQAHGGMGSFRSLSDEYKQFAQELFKQYFRRMGIPESGAMRQAAIEIFDLDQLPLGWGLNWLTHAGGR